MPEIYDPDILHLSDGKLRTEDGYEFDIYKYVLYTENDYFHRLFCGAWGGDRNDFLIPGIKGEILGSILSFMYSGAIDVNESNVHEILVAADYFMCDNLITHIRHAYMTDSLSVSNSLPIYRAALMTNQNDILRTCHRYIQTHFEEVASLDISEIGELPLVALQQFLGNKSLRVRDENAIWVAIAKWVQAYPDPRQSLVPDLLSFLAVSDLDEQLSERILKDDIVACNPFCKDINAPKRWSRLNFYKLLDRVWGCFNIKILRLHIQNHPTPISKKFCFRIPKYFHFILDYRERKPSLMSEYFLHVTYDEKIDLWREIWEVPTLPAYLFCIGDNIYMLTDNFEIRRFNLPSKAWIAMPQLNVSSERIGYGAAQLRGLIYVFGGISYLDRRSDIIHDVEVYDPDKDVWNQLAPMMPGWPLEAVTLGGKIYVISSFRNSTTVQSYDIESNSWTDLSSLSFRYYCSDIFKYRGRLFIMGNISNREDDRFRYRIDVLDHVRDEWTSAHGDLPHGFYFPKVLVVNNELIVYDKDPSRFSSNSVLWNDDLQYWEILHESSPMNKLHKFNFYPQNTEGSGNGITKENKDPAIKFLNSPFNYRI